MNQDDNDKADVEEIEVLKAGEDLLGCGMLTGLLLQRTLQRGGGGKRMSSYTIDYNKVQAEAARDAVWR